MGMKDFFGYDNWFTQKYFERSSHRFFTFQSALGLFLQRGGTNIVETGTTRMADDWGAGMSTYIFGDVAQHYDKRVWTCDILPEAMDVCKTVTKDYSDKITYIVSDSLAFLHTFHEPIDLLYLDSMDCPIFDEPETPLLMASQAHQINELKEAYGKLSEKAVILLDDNWFANGGKTKLSIEHLRNLGWTCVLDSQQSVWIR
jgi:hypothetical protein